MPQTPPAFIHLWVLNIEKMAENQKMRFFLWSECIFLLKISEKVLSGGLQTISNTTLMKYYDNGPPFRVQYVPKRAKNRVLRVSSDLNGGLLSQYFIKFVIEIVYKLPDNNLAEILNKNMH